MFTDTIRFLTDILFTLFGIALILRAWMFAIRLNNFNPVSRAVLQVSDWFVLPIRKVIKPGRYTDWPSLIACYITALIYLIFTWVLFTGSLPPVQNIVPALIASALTMARWAFNVILWATLIQAVLSWVNPMAPIMPLLNSLTAPLLNPIRRVLPNLGGLDLSPLVLLIAAQVAMMLLQRMAFVLFGV